MGVCIVFTKISGRFCKYLPNCWKTICHWKLFCWLQITLVHWTRKHFPWEHNCLLCRPFAWRHFHCCMWNPLQSKTLDTTLLFRLALFSDIFYYCHLVRLADQCKPNAESMSALQSYFILLKIYIQLAGPHNQLICGFFVCLFVYHQKCHSFCDW